MAALSESAPEMGRSARPIALTIAGSDSGGGAGIQADLKTFQAFGVYGASALTAITAQNTRGVFGVQLLLPDLVAAQIDAVAEDLGVNSLKTGMLGNAAIIEAVADRIRYWSLQPRLVIDPVMIAKSGDSLLEASAVNALATHLLPLARVVTPNIPEAEVLLGRKIASDDDVRDAARELVHRGARAVVLKGGHREGRPVDVFFDGAALSELEGTRIQTPNTHGTGCTFSAAIAAGLALGNDLYTSVQEAKLYIQGAIERAVPIGSGHGPVAHDWRGLRGSHREVPAG